MTAIVGVMNRHAIAIAADSAVTMGNTHKVVNNGNKLFMLSKYEPVGIATYSNAALMGTPWEIIIKIYRKQLGEKHFPHLSDYVIDFIHFLHTHNFFTDDITQHNWLKNQIEAFYILNLRIICQKFNFKNFDYNDPLIIEKLKDELNSCLDANKINPSICDDFVGYTFEQFKNETKVDFDEIYQHSQVSNLPIDLRDLFCEAFFYYWIIQLEPDYHTGLVFCGYGDDDLYPSIIPCVVATGYNKRLKYFINQAKADSISEHGTSVTIAPFAQTDVIQTITQGLTPDCQNIIFNTIKNGVDSYTDTLCRYLSSKPEGKKFADEISKLDISSIIKTLSQGVLDSMRDSYTRPLLNTIAGLAKEDLANMAESFISLTCLIRRMSPSEETVGGPIDVAVISKGDGFIWMNRKHYFNPELNKHFFNNYYR
jgi:hypothetical protein